MAGKDLLPEVGRRIRALRAARKWTQDDLAERLGLADNRLVSFFENGRRDLRLSTLGRIAKALEVKICDLVPEGNNPTAKETDLTSETRALLSGVGRLRPRERRRFLKVAKAFFEG